MMKSGGRFNTKSCLGATETVAEQLLPRSSRPRRALGQQSVDTRLTRTPTISALIQSDANKGLIAPL